MKQHFKKRVQNIIWHFKSIQDAILLPFLIVITLALAVFLLISLNYTEKTVLRNSEEYTMQLIEQINADLDSYIGYMETISMMVVGNPDVSQYLFGDDENQEEMKDKVGQQFKTLIDTRTDICNIAVLADNGKMYLNRGKSALNPNADIKDMDWYKDTMKANGSSVVSSSHVQNAISGAYTWVVTLSRALLNPKTQEKEGIFFIDLNYSSISGLCERVSLGDRGYLFILSEDGSYIYHPQQQLIYSGLKTEWNEKVLEQENGSFITDEGNNSKLYTVCSSRETGWKVVGVAYLDELMKDREGTKTLYGLTALLLSLLAIVLSMFISRAITKPIRELEGAMIQVQKGKFDNQAVTARGNNEISSLGNSFNIMTEKIQQLMDENIQEQREKRKNELRALQSQINPHFLYNTLDSIIWMAESGKNEEVVLMTSSLAKLFRQSISNEDEVVTIAQEIEYTRSYLTIQKMRYRDQLEFVIDVDEDILKCHIVKLVIQPLVENSIYHGIKYIDGKGMISIMGGRSDGKIVLIISDNGAGMEQEAVEHILDQKAPNHKSNHVGVYNVHHRLQLYYGQESGLKYESVRGVGTTVFVSIPEEERQPKDGKV